MRSFVKRYAGFDALLCNNSAGVVADFVGCKAAQKNVQTFIIGLYV
jgi:hypothetical protein